MSIFEKALQYANTKPSRWHTPGHKGKLPINLAELDLTELEIGGKDITSLVFEAEQRAAEMFKAERAFFLVNGSSAGILAALRIFKRGSRILIERGAHKSVYNACALAGLNPVIIENEQKDGINQPLSVGAVERAIGKTPSICALVATSPNYFGQIADLEGIKKVLAGRVLIADSAHGAHFSASSAFPKSASEIADICILGGHKTLPVLTQGAYLTLKNREYEASISAKLDEITTTSPSYLILGSLEYAIDFMQNAQNHAHQLKECIESLEKIVPLVGNQDFSRIVVDCLKWGLDAEAAAKYLSSIAVEPEFCTNRHLVFILSIIDSVEDIQRLSAALIRAKSEVKQGFLARQSIKKCPRKMSFLRATQSQTELVEIKNAKGRIAAREAGVLPPCTPLIVRGEVISDEVVQALLSAQRAFGVQGQLIEVVKL